MDDIVFKLWMMFLSSIHQCLAECCKLSSIIGRRFIPWTYAILETLWFQGGVTPIQSVLPPATGVKIKVNGQAHKTGKGQRSSFLSVHWVKGGVRVVGLVRMLTTANQSREWWSKSRVKKNFGGKSRVKSKKWWSKILTPVAGGSTEWMGVTPPWVLAPSLPLNATAQGPQSLNAIEPRF